MPLISPAASPQLAEIKKAKDIQEALAKNISQLIAQQVPQAILENEGAIFINNDGVLNFKFTSEQARDAFKEQIKPPEFSEKSIFSFENSLLLTGIDGIKFCVKYGGLNLKQVEALYKDAGFDKEKLASMLKEYESKSQLAPSKPITPVSILSDDEFAEKIEEFKLDGKASKVFKELITSEKDYLENLKRIGLTEKENYLRVYDGLSNSEKKAFISRAEFEKLLDAYINLTATHESVLADIQKDPRNIEQHLDKLKEIYSKYIPLYQAMLNKGKIPDQINNLYKNDPNFKGLELASFLVKPNQRVMKYKDINNELLKVLPQDHPMFQRVALLQNELEGLAALANQSAGILNLEQKFITVTLKLTSQDAGHRKKAKAMLRGYDDSAGKLPSEEKNERTREQAGKIGLEGLIIEESDKGILDVLKKEAEFILKSDKPPHEPIFKVTVSAGEIKVKELRPGNLDQKDYQQQLDTLNAIVQKLAAGLNQQPTIGSEQPDKIVALKSLGINSKNPFYYQLGAAQKSNFAKLAADADTTDITTSKNLQKIYINYNVDNSKFDNNPVNLSEALTTDRNRIRSQFEAIINEGLMVPVIKIPQMGTTTDQSDIGNEPNPKPIVISTRNPLLAIKQFESVLAAGFTPTFSEQTKKAVKQYVDSALKNNVHNLQDPKQKDVQPEQQIKISAPLDSNLQMNGEEVLRRVKVATSQGLLVKLDDKAKEALKAYIAAQNTEGLQKCAVEVGDHPEPTLMIRNLIELGILPVLPRDVKKIKDSLKMHEHLAPIKLDSGNIAQDFIVFKVLLGQLGMKTEVNQDAMRAHVGTKDHVTTISLSNLSVQEQITQAQALAKMGLNALLTVSVPPLTVLDIHSNKPIHAKEIFENALNQGFKPEIKNGIHQKMEVPLGVKVEGTDPKILFERVQHCMAYGYMPVLLQEQKEILQNYAKNHPASLTVSGFHGQAVIRNLTLAMELGFSVLTTDEAKKANEMFLQGCNTNNKPEKVTIHPIMQQKTRFFFFKRTEVNLEETAKNAQTLQDAGFCVDLTALHSLREEAATKKGKTRFFSNKLTDAAQRWERFFTDMVTVDATDDIRVKEIAARKPKQNTVMPVVSDSADKRPAAKLSAPYLAAHTELPLHPSEPNRSPSAGLEDTVKKTGEAQSKPDRDKNKV